MAKKTVVLEINNDWLKVVEIATGKHKSRVTKLAVKKTSLENEQIKQNLIDLLKESKVRNRRIITYIPRYLLTVKNIELPSPDPEEIKNMVGLQVGKETPYSKDEIIYDYKIIENSKEGFSKIMLVIIRSEIVNSYLSILRSVNLKIDKIGISSEGMLNWYLINAKKTDGDKAVILCDIDSNFTDFTIIYNETLVFTRSISIGANQLANDTGMWQTKFVDELRRSITIYSNEEIGREISEIILSGAMNRFHGINSLITTELSLPVSLIDPFDSLTVSKNIPFEDRSQKISFSALIGSAVGPRPPTIDLTPARARLERELEEKAKDLTIMGTLLIFIVIIAVGILFKKTNDKEQILKRLETRLTRTEREAKEISRMMRINELVRKREDINGTALVVFDELYSVVPNELYFSSISFDAGKNVIIRGVSSSMSHVFKFITTLENLSYFSNVKTNYATKRRLKEKELTDFEIICPIDKTGDRRQRTEDGEKKLKIKN